MQQILTRGVRVGLMKKCFAGVERAPPPAALGRDLDLGCGSEADPHSVRHQPRKVRILFPVGNPDILNLRGVLQKPPALGNLRIKPVDSAAFVGKDLFEISHRHRLCRRRIRLISKAPDGVDVIMLGERFQKL